mgnify:CR=1 FL=1
MPVNLVHQMDLNVNETADSGLFGFWGEEPVVNTKPGSRVI